MRNAVFERIRPNSIGVNCLGGTVPIFDVKNPVQFFTALSHDKDAYTIYTIL